MTRRNGQGDPLCVRTEELARVIQRWLDEWRAERQDTTWKTRGSSSEASSWGERTWFADYFQDAHSEGMPITGALDALSAMSGIHERAITRITRLETKFTSYGLADDLLQAMERPDVIQTGEVRVIPNPRWGAERWKAWQQEEGRSC